MRRRFSSRYLGCQTRKCPRVAPFAPPGDVRGVQAHTPQERATARIAVRIRLVLGEYGRFLTGGPANTRRMGFGGLPIRAGWIGERMFAGHHTFFLPPSLQRVSDNQIPRLKYYHPCASTHGGVVARSITRASQRRVARGDPRRTTARCRCFGSANILGYSRRWPMCDRSAVRTPLAAKRNCLGSLVFPPTAAACAWSTEVRHSARLPSLHKLTSRG
jgi:hypothetical protein